MNILILCYTDLNQHVYASSCDVESISTEPTQCIQKIHAKIFLLDISTYHKDYFTLLVISQYRDQYHIK